MAIQSESTDDDFLTYTREWIDKVSRGGLFPLNDATYIFFVSVEKEVHAILLCYMAKQAGSKDAFKELVIQKIVDSEQVQWNWILISQCIDSEDDAIELLKEIVTLWVTIRGFSITAMWWKPIRETTRVAQRKPLD